MMNIKVMFFDIFRRKMGKKELQLKLGENVTLGQLLKVLCTKYKLREIFDESGNIDLETVVGVDGKITRNLNYRLYDGCIVTISSAVAGG